MLLLIVYIFIALGFSFLCSIAEAVLLSVTPGYVAVMEKNNKPAASLLRELKEDINKPLAAILTLNTIAHTVGAAGAGAQATAVFGNAYLGIISAVLTLLILIFSEIIPKTLGAHYWQALAPYVAYSLRVLICGLYPFVKLSEYMTRSLTHGPSLKGFNRDELVAMAELSWREGVIEQQESHIVKSLLSMHNVKVEHAMTPTSVMFSIPETMTLQQYNEQHRTERFSRIPVYGQDKNEITGFVLLNDVLLAQVADETQATVAEYKRELPVIIDHTELFKAFDLLVKEQVHIHLVVDEYGGVQGLLTLEDVLETLLGLEIIDEGDKSGDMQELARRFWRRRISHKGISVATAEERSDDASVHKQ